MGFLYNEWCHNNIQKEKTNGLKIIPKLTKLLLQCMNEPDFMVAMPELFCDELMEAEITNKTDVGKHMPKNATVTEADTFAAILIGEWGQESFHIF